MKRVALGIVAATLVTAAQAEPMYISDKLVVNVYTEADQESSKLTTLDSGDAVEVIEKTENFTHVRLADSRDGWIKSSYLSSQVPAIVRLKALEKERVASAPPSAQVGEEIKQLKERNAALQSELTAAKSITAPPPTAVQPIVTPAPQSRLASERSTIAPATFTHSMGWGAGFALVGGLIGFLLGYQALARRIRRKYGSMRIY
jgi:SH3 domain protein